MKRKKTPGRVTVSVDTFRTDPLLPRIVRAVETQLARGKVVTPVDVLVDMKLLRRFITTNRSRVIELVRDQSASVEAIGPSTRSRRTQRGSFPSRK